ncbi:MAG TPA: DUF4058 family protein [Isosphaeraceae bacterium]|nr:DUF4058 family protein [Isosphaeraceae bacterium]
MPIHDWTRVDAGIFHHFHHRWISAITDVLNERLLPRQYYALSEQQGAGFEPDVLTLKSSGQPEPDRENGEPPSRSLGGDGDGVEASRALLLAEPRVRITAESDLEFYRRKQNVAAVRHVSGDRLVAVVEIVSKGNKSGRKVFEDLVRKATEFLSHQIHLLIIDLQPAGSRDPQGIHGAIWDEVAGEDYNRPVDKPLTLAAYESGAVVRAFIEPISVGDMLIDMPLFLERGRHVAVPLEETYRTAFQSVPRRWRSVLEAG